VGLHKVLSLTTLISKAAQRRKLAGDGDGLDRRKGSQRHVMQGLTDEERQRILLTCNEPEFAALPRGRSSRC